MPHPVSSRRGQDVFAGLRAAHLAAMEEWRGMQARTLDLYGFGVREHAYDVVASGSRWRLRRYPGQADGVALLLVPAPIKRPYIWDLIPSVSVVRRCQQRRFSVFLMEWLPPADGDGDAGIEAYARAVVAAGEAVAMQCAGTAPFVLGHSLGGTLAAIACGLRSDLARGLVLLGAPLSFEPGSSQFRDLVVAHSHQTPEDCAVAGSQLSQSCALLAPATFVWSRWMDGLLCLADPAALEIHMHVERWALDEVSLPGRLLRQIVEWLYREDRLQGGTLSLAGRMLAPEDFLGPVLAVVSDVDEIGPRAAVEPFLARMAGTDSQIISHPAEVGVGLQHLAILIGRRAHAETWPRIVDWIAAHA